MRSVSIPELQIATPGSGMGDDKTGSVFFVTKGVFCKTAEANPYGKPFHV